MNKLFTTLGVLALLAIPAQNAFAWEYTGLGSLNPFTNFGRGFGNSECGCGCQDMARPKLTKCEKLHGYKIIKDEAPCGYAAPVTYETIVVPAQQNCTGCMKAF